MSATTTHSSTTPTAPINTRQLSMHFGREIAVDDLSLTIPTGAIYALVGPNGAGKTTLIKLLLNILRPTSGTASVLGNPSTTIAGTSFNRIAYVSENQEMPEWMTVTGMLNFLRPFYPQWDPVLEQELIRQFDVPMNRKLRHLSRGQRMKAALLSVLPYHPSLIILDEPFSGLDPLVRDELTEGLLDRAAQPDPPTILISSHDLSEIETLATHIGFLDRGRLVFSEDSAVLTSRFREVTVTLAPPPPSGAAPAITSPAYPASWLLPELSPSVFRFIHSHADTEPLAEQVHLHLPSVNAIEAEPMSLRAIFLALAKTARSQASPSEASHRSRA